MKKLVVLIFIVLLLAACSDEWYAHDSVYKDWEHIKFRMSAVGGERRYPISLLNNCVLTATV
jgi:hypothetical protein